jgi:alcohol dehydrogenase
MRAVVFQGPGEPMTVEEVERPECPPDGVVVETEACGVCRSDWHAWQGDWSWIGLTMTPGLVFGHEPAGTVVEAGEDVRSVSEGDRVTNPFNLADGSCVQCREGHQNRCERMTPMGFVDFSKGAFAEEYAIRTADTNAVKLRPGRRRRARLSVRHRLSRRRPPRRRRPRRLGRRPRLWRRRALRGPRRRRARCERGRGRPEAGGA